MTRKDFGPNPSTPLAPPTLLLCVCASGKGAPILLVLGLVCGLLMYEDGHVVGSVSDPVMLAAAPNLLLTEPVSF